MARSDASSERAPPKRSHPIASITKAESHGGPKATTSSMKVVANISASQLRHSMLIASLTPSQHTCSRYSLNSKFSGSICPSFPRGISTNRSRTSVYCSCSLASRSRSHAKKSAGIPYVARHPDAGGAANPCWCITSAAATYCRAAAIVVEATFHSSCGVSTETREEECEIVPITWRDEARGRTPGEWCVERAARHVDWDVSEERVDALG